MNIIELVHEQYTVSRRVRVLSRHLAAFIPQGAHLLDIGCGDGFLTSQIAAQRPDLGGVTGIDVLERTQSYIPMKTFDGAAIPHPDKSFDTALLVDVLHHTTDPAALLAEARRVARHSIVLKDHTRDGFLAQATLRFMDEVGNRRFGVALPYNYLSRAEWLKVFDSLGLSIEKWMDSLRLYPFPASLFFDRKLHFVASLKIV